MKNEVVLNAINTDINHLMHYGLKGQKWYVNQADRFQYHAKYAKGARPSEKKSVIKQVKNAIGDFDAKALAKNDAAYKAMELHGMDTKGAQRHNRYRNFSKALGGAVGGAAGTAIGAGVGKVGGALLSKTDSAWQHTNLDKNHQYVENYYNALHQKLGQSGNMSKTIKNAGDLRKTLIEQDAWLSSDGFNKNASIRRVAEKRFQDALTKQYADSGLGFGAGFLGVQGAVLGAKAGGKLYDTQTYNGYLKRGKGTLTNTKMSAEQQKTYKETFDKYLSIYSEKTNRSKRQEQIYNKLETNFNKKEK